MTVDSNRIAWAGSIRRRYGLEVEDFARMLQAQDKRCAICDKEFWKQTGKGNPKIPCVDHNHKTGEVRGLLCNWCNYKFLGPLERGGRDRAMRAIPYLGWGVVK